MQMANLAEAKHLQLHLRLHLVQQQKKLRFVNEMAHAFGMTKAEMQKQMAVTGSVIQGLGSIRCSSWYAENILIFLGPCSIYEHSRRCKVPAKL